MTSERTAPIAICAAALIEAMATAMLHRVIHKEAKIKPELYTAGGYPDAMPSLGEIDPKMASELRADATAALAALRNAMPALLDVVEAAADVVSHGMGEWCDFCGRRGLGGRHNDGCHWQKLIAALGKVKT